MQRPAARDLGEALDLAALEGLVKGVVELHRFPVRLLAEDGAVLLEVAPLDGQPPSAGDTGCQGVAVPGGRLLLGPVPPGTGESEATAVLQLLRGMVMALGGERHERALSSHASTRMLERNRELEARNRTLEQMYARMRELDRMKSTFLATMSH